MPPALDTADKPAGESGLDILFRDQAPSPPAEAANIETLTDMADVRDLWTGFEKHAVCSAYQRFVWADTWHRTIGKETGANPVITVLKDNQGEVSAILPFLTHRRGPVRTATWLGDANMNYHMGLFRRDRIAGFGAHELRTVLQTVARRHGVDLFALSNQPFTWDGFENPFQALPHAPSADIAYCQRLEGEFEAFYTAQRSNKARSQLRRKERRMAEECVLESRTATDSGEALDLIGVYLEQKKARFAKQGIANPFADETVQAFLRDLVTTKDKDGEPAMRLDALYCDGKAIAIMGGTGLNGRYSVNIVSITNGLEARNSPGEILLRDLVERLYARGEKAFDLGVGDARYKREWCVPDLLFNTVLPVSALGHCATFAFNAERVLKRQIKSMPKAHALGQRMLAVFKRG